MKKFISGLSDSAQRFINYFIDPSSGEYLFPIIFDTEQEFDSSLYYFDNTSDDTPTNHEIKICIIDSGLLIKHPLFRDRVLDSIDFTGEGIDDRNGHGTMISYLWLVRNPLKDWSSSIKFLVAKVLNKNIQGTEENLISAIDWAVNKGAHIINISAGIDRQIWFYNPCKGTCKLCRTAEKAANKVFAFHASAGNNGKTVCPARSGIYNPNSKVIAIGAKNSTTGEKEQWSGSGTIYLRGNVKLQPITKTNSTENRLDLIEQMMTNLWNEKKYEKAMSYLIQLRDGVFQIGATDHQFNLFKDKFCRLRNLIADKYFNEGNYDLALKYYLDSLNEFYIIKGNSENVYFGILLSIGICYVETGNYKEALENITRAKEIYEGGQIPNRDDRLYYLHEYLGICNLHNKEPYVAIKNFEIAIEYSKEFFSNTNFYIHNCFLNIASAKAMLGELCTAKKLLEIISGNEELLKSSKQLELFNSLKSKITNNE